MHCNATYNLCSNVIHDNDTIRIDFPNAIPSNFLNVNFYEGDVYHLFREVDHCFLQDCMLSKRGEALNFNFYYELHMDIYD